MGDITTIPLLLSLVGGKIEVLVIQHSSIFHPKPSPTTTMSSFLGKPTPVRLCRVCWTTHHVDSTGVNSLELEEWYCSDACRHVRRFKLGLTEISSGVGHEIMKTIDRHYQPDVLSKRRAKVLDRFQNGEERAISEVIHHDNNE